jgi:hypothetical protein
MSRLLTNRIAKLEAKHKVAANRIVGVIGGEYGRLIPDPDKPGYLKFSEHPLGFVAWALQQQTELQNELSRLFAEDAPQPAGITANVGTPNILAPLPEGKKRPRYIEINGEEIDALAHREN